MSSFQSISHSTYRIKTCSLTHTQHIKEHRLSRWVILLPAALEPWSCNWKFVQQRLSLRWQRVRRDRCSPRCTPAARRRTPTSPALREIWCGANPRRAIRNIYWSLSLDDQLRRRWVHLEHEKMYAALIFCLPSLFFCCFFEVSTWFICQLPDWHLQNAFFGSRDS